MEQTFNQLKEAIVQANGNRVDELLGAFPDSVDFDQVFNQCISPALDALCTGIRQKQCAIPELLMGLKQVHRIARTVSDKHSGAVPQRQTIVMGVVQGDIHDMGKNIIRDVCQGYGFTVIDLGKNVSPDAFVAAAEEKAAEVACLSTMLSTTIDSVSHTVRELKSRRPGIRVLIGGAFMNDAIAARVGADGYAENAATVMPVLERVVQ